MNAENYLLREESVRIAELEAENARLTRLLEESGKEKMHMFLMSRDWATLCGKAEAQRDKLLDALKEVLRYRRGQGKYNFSKINEDHIANVLYDAWSEIQNKIEQAIAEVEGK